MFAQYHHSPLSRILNIHSHDSLFLYIRITRRMCGRDLGCTRKQPNLPVMSDHGEYRNGMPYQGQVTSGLYESIVIFVFFNIRNKTLAIVIIWQTIAILKTANMNSWPWKYNDKIAYMWYTRNTLFTDYGPCWWALHLLYKKAPFDNVAIAGRSTAMFLQIKYETWHLKILIKVCLLMVAVNDNYTYPAFAHCLKQFAKRMW